MRKLRQEVKSKNRRSHASPQFWSLLSRTALAMSIFLNLYPLKRRLHEVGQGKLWILIYWRRQWTQHAKYPRFFLQKDLGSIEIHSMQSWRRTRSTVPSQRCQMKTSIRLLKVIFNLTQIQESSILLGAFEPKASVSNAGACNNLLSEWIDWAILWGTVRLQRNHEANTMYLVWMPYGTLMVIINLFFGELWFMVS